MPRKPRQKSASGYYHVINRGVNKKKIFHRLEDFDFYKSLLREYKERFDIQIFHYCLMSNHTHAIFSCPDVTLLSKFSYFVQRRYVYYYCKTYKWSEQVFRSRFLSFPIDRNSYLLECARYIERNPLNANLVNDPKDYPHSSFNHYAYGVSDSLITESPLFSTLGRTPEERMLVYRFNVLHYRDYEVEKNKALKKLITKPKVLNSQPVPF